MQRNCRRGQRRALQEIFVIVFFFLCFGSKKNCVRQAQARLISNTSTHIFAAVCPGRRGGGVD